MTTRRSLLKAAAALPLAAAASRATAQTAHTVTISNFAFQPASLTISAGDSVTFVNEDSAPHTATDTGGAWDTGRLARGQSRTFTFNAAGSFNYFCAIHPSMTATLTIA